MPPTLYYPHAVPSIPGFVLPSFLGVKSSKVSAFGLPSHWLVVFPQPTRGHSLDFCNDWQYHILRPWSFEATRSMAHSPLPWVA